MLSQKISNFIKTELSKEEKKTAKNFTYHITRIVASIATSRAKYDANHMATLDFALITNQTIRQAYDLLLQILADYQVENPQENILNIAKAKKFADKINEDMQKKYR